MQNITKDNNETSQGAKDQDLKLYSKEETVDTNNIPNDKMQTTIWNGTIDFPAVAWAHVTIKQTFGYQVEKFSDNIINNEKFRISDTIPIKMIKDDIKQIDDPKNKIFIMNLLPKSKEEFYSYMAIYNYFKTNNLVGVVNVTSGITKIGGKTYFIIPLAKDESMFPNIIDLGENHEKNRLVILYFKEEK